MLGALWSLGEPEEDEGEMEEPEDCTTEKAEFDWAHTWLEDEGAPALAEDKAQGLFVQVFCLLRPPSLLFYSSVLFPCPDLWPYFSFRVCVSCIRANFLRQEADHLWLEANDLEAKGLQQLEFAIVRSEAEGLYALLWGAISQLDLSISVDLPLPKRHKGVAMATVSSFLTAQESEAIVPKPKG